MTLVDSSRDNPNRSIRIKFERRLDNSFRPLIDWFSNKIVPSARNRSTKEKVALSLSCLFANLLRANELSSKCFLAISLRSEDYTQGRYNRSGIGFRNFDKTVKFLIDPLSPLIEFRIGFQDRETNYARSTRVRAGQRLLGILNAFATKVKSGELIEDINISELIADSTTETRVPPADVAYDFILEDSDPEIIILRNEDKEAVDYSDSEFTEAARVQLNKWNNFAADHFHIDLLLTDNGLSNAFEHEHPEDRNFFGEGESDVRFVELRRKTLHRVFNNSSFDEGGRFYGGWWQSILSKFRPLITINGIPTVEVDYSGMHAAMLYAKVGKPVPSDAYELDGIPTEYRKLIKRTFFKLINAKPGQRIQAPFVDSLPPGWTWKQLQKAVIDRHAPIAQYLRSGAGLKLQKIDSEIAETVMLRMMDRDVLVLPVHDSFLTYIGQENVLKAEMKRAYLEKMGTTIEMTSDQIDQFFYDDEAEESEQLTSSDAMDNILNQPGYEGYKRRWKAFEDSRSDEWHRRFGDSPRESKEATERLP